MEAQRGHIKSIQKMGDLGRVFKNKYLALHHLQCFKSLIKQTFEILYILFQF